MIRWFTEKKLKWWGGVKKIFCETISSTRFDKDGKKILFIHSIKTKNNSSRYEALKYLLQRSVKQGYGGVSFSTGKKKNK